MPPERPPHLAFQEELLVPALEDVQLGVVEFGVLVAEPISLSHIAAPAKERAQVSLHRETGARSWQAGWSQHSPVPSATLARGGGAQGHSQHHHLALEGRQSSPTPFLLLPQALLRVAWFTHLMLTGPWPFRNAGSLKAALSARCHLLH